ncbi:hypothetical protein [Flavobacterium sp.]|uniref:hypothetical protein n=1 Tax=Flavobacterium sp. TaxID=239 RepID=UPI00375342BE
MIPELSSNNKFNMPSLSTFFGLIPKVPNIGVYAFAFSLAEVLIMQLNEEQDKIINESFWLEWQNAKRQGLEKVLAFINTPWADKNGFKKVEISKTILENLFKGQLKNYNDLFDSSKIKDEEKNYFVIVYRIKNDKLDTFTDIVDCIIINN